MYFAQALNEHTIKRIAGAGLTENEQRAFVAGFRKALELAEYIKKQEAGPAMDELCGKVLAQG